MPAVTFHSEQVQTFFNLYTISLTILILYLCILYPSEVFNVVTPYETAGKGTEFSRVVSFEFKKYDILLNYLIPLY